MSPSLPPPPRKLSSPANISNFTPSPRYPKINPNHTTEGHDDDDDDLDEALAQMMAQSHINIHPDHLNQPHLPHCKHYTRPHSITSLSSLGSESYSTYGSSHSRRVSQAYLSPLSPAISEPSASSPTSSYFASFPNDDASSSSHEDMVASSSFPSCTYCSSVRSNSICSVLSNGQQAAEESRSSQYLSPSSPSSPKPRGFEGRKTQGRDSHYYDNQRLEHLRDLVPSVVRTRLSYHLDECWFVHFAPSGEYMASTGLDHSIIIWRDLQSPEPSIHKTITFTWTVSQVEWSPDSRYLLMNFGFDRMHPDSKPEINVYDAQTGNLLLTTCHNPASGALLSRGVGWMSDSKRFVSFGEDRLFVIRDLQGTVLRTGSSGDVIPKFAKILAPLNMAAILSQDRALVVLSLEGDENMNDSRILAVSLSEDPDFGRAAHVNLYETQNWSFLRTLEAETYVSKTFVIVPTFGGPNDELICCGSENGILHFWDVETGELVKILEEHSQHVGCGSFSPIYPGLMVSCSDDNHIIIWVTKDLSHSLQDADQKWIEKRKASIKPPINIKNGW
ncbi:hypothetical protein BGZ93_000364 [Podila epicladia]|nr:hypothetical protein BGZ92_001214 [Podila epicladia]KAG0098346.1 hypothetical protein BGZ93_000364 [Podila epicladia]